MAQTYNQSYRLSLSQIDDLTESGNLVLKTVAIQCAEAMRESERLRDALLEVKAVVSNLPEIVSGSTVAFISHVLSNKDSNNA